MASEHVVDAAIAVIELCGGSVTRAAMRAALDAADRARAPSAFACADGAQMRANHRLRALQAVASHICSSDLTDGFCGPQDGKCRWEKDDRRVGCVRKAEHILRAIEAVGCAVVWEHDPTLTVTIARKP